MYGFLFDQTYINLIIMGFFLFLIMFLWRKITIIEGNYFILEKRVDMIKKTDRDSLISKNMEKADVVMNEIFKDSTSVSGGVSGGASGSSVASGGKKNYCNNVSYCPPEAILKSQKNTPKDSRSSKDSEDIDMSSYMIDAVAAVASATAVSAVASKPEIVISQVDIADIADVAEDASVVVESNNKIEIIECKEGDDVVINKNVEYGDGDNAPDVPSVVKVDMTAVRNSDHDSENDIRDILYASSALGGAGGSGSADTADNNIDNDAMSVSSDITFGTDQDKYITKKYKKMSIEKLREECVEKSLNSEGTKAILIGRILEYNKKA
jgi:hypothetical protein